MMVFLRRRSVKPIETDAVRFGIMEHPKIIRKVGPSSVRWGTGVWATSGAQLVPNLRFFPALTDFLGSFGPRSH